MTRYLGEHPKLADRLLEILQEVRALGHEPVPMEGVRQPFDYAPRIPRRIHEPEPR
jgi:hypothetical protein